MAKHYADQSLWNILGLHPNQDFHELPSEKVEGILAEAKRVGYRRPKNANGSTARYFYEKLQREYWAMRKR